MNDDEARPKRLTRAEAKARTRVLLLDAGAEVFARKGYAGASVDDIAERAGFTTGALYAHFGGKEDLFVELLAERRQSRLAEATAIASDAGGSLDDLQTALSRLVVEAADKDADIAPLQAEFWLYALRRPEFRQHFAGQFRSDRDVLTAVLADRGRARGQSDDIPFADVATVLLALFQGLVQLRRTDPDLVPEALYGQAARWLFAGITRPRPDQD